jgi:hypothetical protein
MDESQFPPYDELPSRIRELTARLGHHGDGEVVQGVLRLHLWNEEFNRAGVIRLVDMILAWRGEIFLDAVMRDDVLRVFLARYGVPGPE